jgi:uncharacterized protein (UPF0147 family)
MLFDEKEEEKPASISFSGANPGPKTPRPQKKFEEIRVDEEIAEVYASAKTLLDLIIEDDDVPANQRAQVLNSVSNMIQQMVKSRVDLYNAERIRRMEQVLLQVMRAQPLEVRQAFFDSYSKALGGMDAG